MTSTMHLSLDGSTIVAKIDVSSGTATFIFPAHEFCSGCGSYFEYCNNPGINNLDYGYVVKEFHNEQWIDCEFIEVEWVYTSGGPQMQGEVRDEPSKFYNSYGAIPMELYVKNPFNKGNLILVFEFDVWLCTSTWFGGQDVSREYFDVVQVEVGQTNQVTLDINQMDQSFTEVHTADFYLLSQDHQYEAQLLKRPGEGKLVLTISTQVFSEDETVLEFLAESCFNE